MPVKVAAILAIGTDADRAIAVALAEAGADIAIGSLEKTQQQEFATASIANEIWAIGRENFSTALDATDPTAVAAFAAETADRLGRCDLLVVRATGAFVSPPDEISPDEWERALRYGLTVPFIAAHSFAPIIERDGGGTIVFLPPEDHADSLAAHVTAAARQQLISELTAALQGRNLKLIESPSSSSLPTL